MCLGTPPERLIFNELLLAHSHSVLSCGLVLPLCFLSYRSTRCGACIVHCLSLFHILSRSLGGCHLLKMADRKSLIPSDTQYSSYLVYHTDSHLSCAYINNYTAPVLHIIVVSAQKCVFCCCQEMGIGMSPLFFFSCLGLRFKSINSIRDFCYMLKVMSDFTLKLRDMQFGLI